MQSFTINLKYQLKSIKKGLWILIIVILGLVVFHLTKKISFDDEHGSRFILSMLFILLLIFSPAIYLHINYLIENYKTVLTVDNYSQCISIARRDGSATFRFDDIQIVEKHLGIYYKNRFDHKMRYETPWTNYGYIKLKLKDGRSFYFTSLMLDVMNPPFAINHTKYRFIPDIDKDEVSFAKKRDIIEQNSEERVRYFMKTFEGLSKEALQEKINNPSKYEGDAVNAANKLLDKKR